MSYESVVGASEQRFLRGSAGMRDSPASASLVDEMEEKIDRVPLAKGTYTTMASLLEMFCECPLLR
jgi:hypothetical protein